MTGSVRFHRNPAPLPPLGRLALALTASALVHAMLLSAQLPGLRWRSVAAGPAGVPITVRLALVPNPAPDSPITPEPETRRPPSPPSAEKWGQVRFSESASPAPRQKIEPDPIFPDAPTLPGAPDPNYYPARELDDYPRPLAPLRIDQPPNFSAGEMRLELLIDEHGVVRDITFSGSAEPGGVHEALRGALMATPFVPAVKDGRPVKSRIVLSVGFPTASGQ